MSKAYSRKIILEDGEEYFGYGFGAEKECVCELVFNTSMVGYQEILSDPSYTDQAIVMTYPLIGNYGMAEEDYETEIPTAGALIVREYNDEPSNFRSTKALACVMEQYSIPGVEGIDTRKLTRSIRDHGSRRALITGAECSLQKGIDIIRNTPEPHDAVARVSRKKICRYESASGAMNGGSAETTGTDFKIFPADDMQEISGRIQPQAKYHIVAIDCGMKQNIVRSLNFRGCDVTVVPWNTDAEIIRSLNPDGIFISNGPGDPQDVPETVKNVRSLIGEYPVFGICLGHQIIALAYGAETYKLKFGHRGGNHPVMDLKTGKIEITSQNHSYAVEEKSLAETGLIVTHRNLLDQTVEGLSCKKDRVFSVQYHPESAPGPQDSGHLFDRFINLINGSNAQA